MDSAIINASVNRSIRWVILTTSSFRVWNSFWAENNSENAFHACYYLLIALVSLPEKLITCNSEESIRSLKIFYVPVALSDGNDLCRKTTRDSASSFASISFFRRSWIHCKKRPIATPSSFLPKMYALYGRYFSHKGTIVPFSFRGRSGEARDGGAVCNVEFGPACSSWNPGRRLRYIQMPQTANKKKSPTPEQSKYNAQFGKPGIIGCGFSEHSCKLQSLAPGSKWCL